MGEFTQIVDFFPAFDKRDPDPKKNYGIHGVELRMVLKGPEGAVQFVLYTQWMLPHVQKETDERIVEEIVACGPDFESALICGQRNLDVFHHPMPYDLGYHSPKPMYEGHKAQGSEKYDIQAMLRNAKRMVQGGNANEEVSQPTGTFFACPYLDGKPCYYDGSGLNAERIFDILVKEGSAGVWRELEVYYRETFERSGVAL